MLGTIGRAHDTAGNKMDKISLTYMSERGKREKKINVSQAVVQAIKKNEAVLGGRDGGERSTLDREVTAASPRR